MSQKLWQKEEVSALFMLPITELLFKAQEIHRANFSNAEIELCSILSIKTGTCPEDCAYCPQSGHYTTDIQKERLLPLDEVVEKAKQAKKMGATRFCMGAAWRNPPAKALPKVIEMVKAVNDLGLETCLTVGMLSDEDALALSNAGLDFYNHNLDTSKNYYAKIITTRTYQDRLDTLKRVRENGIKVCCGGILGMGETTLDRIDLLLELANLPLPPESVPINRLMPVVGTPLAKVTPLDNLEFVKTIAVARILMPKSMLRLSAGRSEMSIEMQTLCFLAGANSMWLGDKLLTRANPNEDNDKAMLDQLGMKAMPKQTVCHAD